jgi:hypothetical protein
LTLRAEDLRRVLELSIGGDRVCSSTYVVECYAEMSNSCLTHRASHHGSFRFQRPQIYKLRRDCNRVLNGVVHPCKWNGMTEKSVQRYQGLSGVATTTNRLLREGENIVISQLGVDSLLAILGGKLL